MTHATSFDPFSTMLSFNWFKGDIMIQIRQSSNTYLNQMRANRLDIFGVYHEHQRELQIMYICLYQCPVSIYEFYIKLIKYCYRLHITRIIQIYSSFKSAHKSIHFNILIIIKLKYVQYCISGRLS